MWSWFVYNIQLDTESGEVGGRVGKEKEEVGSHREKERGRERERERERMVEDEHM